MQQILSIQYLRATAALMVVVFHTIPYTFPSRVIAAAGADLFFVISGFIIAVIIVGREASAGDFLRRRVVRIVPLYWTCTLLLAAAAAAIPAAFSRLTLTPSHLLQSLAFIPHAKPGSAEILPLLEDGWTLNYEMFFYLIVAAALLLSVKHRLAIICSVLLALPLSAVVFPHGNVIAAAYADPILLEFLAGVIIGALWMRRRLAEAQPVYGVALVMVALAGFVLAGLAGNDAEHIRVFAWGGPAALLALGMLILETRIRWRRLAWLALIGDASYSLYLTHGFVIAAVRKLADVFDPSWKAAWPAWIVIAMLSVVVGVVVYRAVELPMLTALRAKKLRHAAAA